MKKFILGFIHRGFLACGGGPIVLALIYLALYQSGAVSEIGVPELVQGILTSALLAFIAGGINAVYLVEELPLVWAILIHGAVLYLDYVIVYLSNGWLKREPLACLVFTVCFAAGYALVWTAIYFTSKRKTADLNRRLEQRQKKS